MLLGHLDGSLALYDAFDGRKVRELTGNSNVSGMELEASFSPDGKFICSGSDDGKIFFWETDTGREVMVLEGHALAVGSAAFNPRYLQLATACQNVVLWLPATPGE